MKATSFVGLGVIAALVAAVVIQSLFLGVGDVVAIIDDLDDANQTDGVKQTHDDLDDANQTDGVRNSHGVDPGKDIDEFRNYEDSDRQDIVTLHYREMRSKQTVAHVMRMYDKYNGFAHARMTVWEAFEALKGYVDSSDPDSSLPNLEHMVQTAEAVRKAGNPDWLVLTGLLHDMGKIMYLWGDVADGQIGRADFPQWGLGGDTWVVGAPLPESAVFPEFNALNPDSANPEYNDYAFGVHFLDDRDEDGAPPRHRCGLYECGAGLANLHFAWGHDEYMYRMLAHNNASLPAEALAVIRYHSCYPLHSHGEYKELLAPDGSDEPLLAWVRAFNAYDLYTKADERPDVAALWPYYQGLIDKYLPGPLDW